MDFRGILLKEKGEERRCMRRKGRKGKGM